VKTKAEEDLLRSAQKEAYGRDVLCMRQELFIWKKNSCWSAAWFFCLEKTSFF